VSPLALLLLAVGVSADAFAVAAARGVTIRRGTVGPALAVAATFGGFQALMPLLGWLVGSRVADGIDRVDHWIAFGLLAAVGLRMIREAFAEGEDDGPPRLGVRELLLLGVATSIDALAVGLGLAFVDVNIVLAISVIGVTTFCFSLLGVRLGQRSGTRFGTAAEVVGGVVLIGIGLHLLLQHLA
jgi:putative Mn2+ efflux pump MntP